MNSHLSASHWGLFEYQPILVPEDLDRQVSIADTLARMRLERLLEACEAPVKD